MKLRLDRPPTFFEELTAAVADFVENGYRDEGVMLGWMNRLRSAALRDMMPQHQAEAQIAEALRTVYKRAVIGEGLINKAPTMEVGRFTLARVQPELRAELDRAILASAGLIKLNRERAVADTLQRFMGWATSIPAGGSGDVDRREVKSNIGKRLQSMSFIDRRVRIDQSHKLAARLTDVFARGGGAIAMRWHRHHTRYPREEHRERDGKVYLVRDTWATERGLVRRAGRDYYDDREKPGELVFCRCTAEPIYALSQLPDEMLTNEGRDELERVRKEMRKLAA